MPVDDKSLQGIIDFTNTTGTEKVQGKSVSADAPSTGQYLRFNGSAWAPATMPTSMAPSGSAGGDLSGTYPSPTVSKIRGRNVVATAPTSGQVLTWDGSNWKPADASSGGLVHAKGRVLISREYDLTTKGVSFQDANTTDYVVLLTMEMPSGAVDTAMDIGLGCRNKTRTGFTILCYGMGDAPGSNLIIHWAVLV